jgi:hypothetical protein
MPALDHWRELGEAGLDYLLAVDACEYRVGRDLGQQALHGRAVR